MAHRRLIDSDIFTHEGLGTLSISCRYFYHGLIILADDEGRVKGSPRYLNSRLFPYDDIPEEDVKAMIFSLSNIGLLTAYQVGAESFLQHPKWAKWQSTKKTRPQVSSLPSVEDGIAIIDQRKTDDAPLVDRRSIKIETYRSLRFAEFWAVYPKRSAKQAALRAWLKLKPSDELINTILKTVAEHKASDSWQKDDGTFIPYPATWLNGRRWEDEKSKEFSWTESFYSQVEAKQG